MAKTKSKGIYKELEIGKVKIVSYISHGYQELRIKLDDCEIEICPHWNDIDQDKNTGIIINIKKGYPIVMQSDKGYKEKHLFLKIYEKRKVDKGIHYSATHGWKRWHDDSRELMPDIRFETPELKKQFFDILKKEE